MLQTHITVQQNAKLSAIPDTHRNSRKKRKKMGPAAVLKVDGKIKRSASQPTDKCKTTSYPFVFSPGIVNDDFVKIRTARNDLVRRAPDNHRNVSTRKLPTDGSNTW